MLDVFEERRGYEANKDMGSFSLTTLQDDPQYYPPPSKAEAVDETSIV